LYEQEVPFRLSVSRLLARDTDGMMDFLARPEMRTYKSINALNVRR
jgi:hypothetical protein